MSEFLISLHMILTQAALDRLSKSTQTDVPQGSIIRKGRSQQDGICARCQGNITAVGARAPNRQEG